MSEKIENIASGTFDTLERYGQLKQKKMRELNLCLFAIITFVDVNCKTLIDSTKLWSTIDYSTYQMTSDKNHLKSYYIKFYGDTIINNYRYNKIQYSNDRSHTDWKLVGFAREDSLQNVYFMDTLLREGLVYSFDVKVGDTLILNNYLRPFLKTNKVVVKRTYSLIFADKLRKAIDVVSYKDTSSSRIETWIEGIGNTLGIIEGGRIISELTGWALSLQCYYENDQIKYHDNEFSDCYYNYTLNINEINNNIRFFNTDNSLIISSNGYTQIYIYNPNGQLIKNDNFIDEYRINKRVLNNGMYLYKIINNNKVMFGKLIKN